MLLQRFVLFALLVLATLGTACKKKEASSGGNQPSSGFKVGLVFDVGGRGDKSFNDAAYRGLERAKKELSTDFEVIEPGEGADREAGLRQLASNKDIKIVFGVGFIFTDDITTVSKEFPEKKFVCIDYTVDTTKKIPDNLAAVVFREEEGSFLVGALAALTSKTNTIGFVGGMDSPLIRKFQNGYANGAKYANPKCNVLSGYAGLTGDGFKNPAKGKEIALSQYNKNADVIFHASGVTGKGVFEAALEKQKFAIGVDSNQEDEAKGLVLTSMVKVVDEAVFNEINAVKTNSFKGGVSVFGLSNKGVDYIYNEKNKALISDSTRAKVESIRAKLVAGEIKAL
jgi:basic membrane protein A and related proteins